MFILITAISMLFKLPVAFIPVVNIYAEFYYNISISCLKLVFVKMIFLIVTI